MTPIQIVALHRPSRWGRYRLPGGLRGLMLGRVELRWRWPMTKRLFVREA